MKKVTIFTTAALTAAILMTGCGAGSKTAMKIGDIKVTQGDVTLITDAYFAQIGDFDVSKKRAVESLEEAVTDYAVAKANGLNLTDEEQAQVRQGKSGFVRLFGSTSEYKKELKKDGASDEIVEAIIAQTLYESKLEEAAGVKDPSDDEVKAYFKENFRRAKHVLLLTNQGEDEDFVKTRAEDILARAKKGENFDDLIKNFSEDPGSTSNPDGYVFTDGDMVDEFDEAVKSIKPGEFTMCKSDYGYHIIQRLALDESAAKFYELWEANKDIAKCKKKASDVKAAIQKMAEEKGITVEKFDDVINTVASPTPTPTEKATDAPAADTASAEATPEATAEAAK